MVGGTPGIAIMSVSLREFRASLHLLSSHHLQRNIRVKLTFKRFWSPIKQQWQRACTNAVSVAPSQVKQRQRVFLHGAALALPGVE